jgi:chromosome segregation ATPase
MEVNMASVEMDLDAQMTALEHEWREAFEDSIAARAEYQALAAGRQANAEALDSARERLDRAEALKAQIMVKIERLEYRLLGRD